MYKFILIPLLIGLLSCSCNKTNKETEILIESFPIEESLHGTRINLTDSEYLSNGAYFAGGYLVFYAIRDNHFLQIYDHDFNLVDKLLYKGEGPNELPDVTWNGQWDGNSANPTIYVFSDSKKRVASLNIHPFEGLTTVCDFPVSESLSPTTLYQTSDTTFVGITLDMLEGTDLFSYNTKTKTVRKAERPFKFVEGYESFYTSQQTMDYNKENLDICCAYLNFPSLVIYDMDFNIIRIVSVSKKVDTEALSCNDENPSFCKVAYYNNFILALLRDEKHVSSKLLIFDTDGNPRASYEMGKALGFVVDEPGQRLLSLKYDYDLDVIYLESHSMPELLK